MELQNLLIWRNFFFCSNVTTNTAGNSPNTCFPAHSQKIYSFPPNETRRGKFVGQLVDFLKLKFYLSHRIYFYHHSFESVEGCVTVYNHHHLQEQRCACSTKIKNIRKTPFTSKRNWRSPQWKTHQQRSLPGPVPGKYLMYLVLPWEDDILIEKWDYIWNSFWGITRTNGSNVGECGPPYELDLSTKN